MGTRHHPNVNFDAIDCPLCSQYALEIKGPINSRGFVRAKCYYGHTWEVDPYWLDKELPKPILSESEEDEFSFF